MISGKQKSVNFSTICTKKLHAKQQVHLATHNITYLESVYQLTCIFAASSLICS